MVEIVQPTRDDLVEQISTALSMVSDDEARDRAQFALRAIINQKSLFALVRDYSLSIVDDRTRVSVLTKIMEETGELATEVAVSTGMSYKKPGPDGVIGETLDCIAALLDLLYLENPKLTEEDASVLLTPKLNKWRDKVRKYNAEQWLDTVKALSSEASHD